MDRSPTADPDSLGFADPELGRWSDATPSTSPELGAWQLARAWSVAEQAAMNNPFYRERLRLPEQRSALSYRSMPVTTKEDVVADCEAAPPFGRRSVCSPGAIRQVVETSGTTGRGREVYVLDEADAAAIHRTEAVGFWWADVRPGSRVLLTLPVAMSAAGTWYHAGLQLLGATILAVGSYSTQRKVDILHRYGADVIVGTPSYVQHLAEACRRSGIEPASLGVRSLIVAGEGYSASWAERLARRWGATLYEQYGSTQRVIAWACPGGVLKGDGLGVLHFPPESAYIEVLDPASGEPVDDGAFGELVVTPFGADVSPLIRFATGDRVRWAAPGACDCGRPLAGIRAGSVHRTDNMLKVRGVNVWPSVLDETILDVPDVIDYRAYVRNRDDGSEQIHVQVESSSANPDELAETITDRMRTTVGIGAQVEVVAQGSITGQIPEGFIKVARLVDERDASLSQVDSLGDR